MYNIAIIGGGVIGLTTAIAIQDKFKFLSKITIYTETRSPYTTGDVSAGLWGPYLLQETNIKSIIDWSSKTQEYFLKLWKTENADACGICLQPITILSEKTLDRPEWLKVPFGYQSISCDRLEKLSKLHKKNYKDGVTYVSLTFEPSKFLPFLEQQFINNNGDIKMRKIDNFFELNSYDIIINCTGLHSRILATDDAVQPIRGQIIRVTAPWQFSTIMSDEHYVIANMDNVVLGGTKQINDYNLNVSESDTRRIIKGCYNISPTLKNAYINGHYVGLRPGRLEVRLEVEVKKNKEKDFIIIHNYGHGGAGVTLSYGCALEVTTLIRDIFASRRSKL